jgi:hypothetical protein
MTIPAKIITIEVIKSAFAICFSSISKLLKIGLKTTKS